jgi:hypothetical protein
MRGIFLSIEIAAIRAFRMYSGPPFGLAVPTLDWMVRTPQLERVMIRMKQLP